MDLSRRIVSVRRLKPSLLLGLFLSLGIGLLCYYITLRTIDTENEERFRNMARTAQYTINARIKSYTNVLRASASLFSAEPDVTRAKFHRYFNSLGLAENYPAIESLNYVHWLKDEQRDTFEAKMGREPDALPDGRPFRITPPGRRPNYAIVVYAEPQSRWLNTLGNDITALPVALKALEVSRDSGLIATSGAPVRPMKAQKQLGLAMRIPVYKVGLPVDTVEQRRAAYFGSVGIAFSVKRLVDGVLDELPLKTVRLSLFNHAQTLDTDPPKPDQLIYDSDSAEENSALLGDLNDPSKFHVWLPVDFNGREWNAHFSTPKGAVYRSSDHSFPLLALLAGITTTMLLYVLFYTLTTSRARAVELAKGMTRELRESEAQLLVSHEKLRQLAAHAENIKEIERKRIAREIHDDLGQNLLALRIEAQMLFSRTQGHHPRLNARANATLEQIDATIKSVRQIINDLRPNVLDLGLNAAVAWQIADFQRRTGIKCDLVEYHTEIVVDDVCATALFRILQESLTNIRRHALANWVRVDLLVEQGFVRMSIRDNGVGLQGAVYKPGTFGLIGMQERVAMLGGTFSLGDSPGGGTTVEVAIPVRPEKSHHTEEAADIREPEQLQDELV